MKKWLKAKIKLSVQIMLKMIEKTVKLIFKMILNKNKIGNLLSGQMNMK